MASHFRSQRNRDSMAKWIDHKTAVRESLKRQGKTVYWLHSQLPANTSRTLIYDYLRKPKPGKPNNAGLSVENMERINKVLGIRYTDE